MSEPGLVARRPPEWELRCPVCGKPIVRWEVEGELLGTAVIRIKGVCRNRRCEGYGRERTGVIRARVEG